MKQKRIFKVTSIVMVFIFGISLFSGMILKPEKAHAAQDLVLHLKFDSDLTDSSGSGNNAQCANGNITYTDGIFGKAAVFNGKSYLEIPDSDSLDLKTFTISLWAYKTKNMKTDVYVPYVYKQEDQDHWASPYQLYEKYLNVPNIWLNSTADDTELNQVQMEGNPIDIQKWFLLTATFSGSEIRLYEDGVLTKKMSVKGIPDATVGNLYIGMLNGELFYNGYMDDLRIYNRAFSSQEVAGLFDEGMKYKPEFLTQKNAMTAYYKFDGDAKDSSPFKNDAKLVTGSVKYVDGLNGKAAQFTKAAYFEAMDSASLDFDEGFSATAWVKVAKEETEMALFYKTGVSTSDESNDMAYSFYVYHNYFNLHYAPFGLQLSNSYNEYSFEDSQKNKWVHYAVTFNTKEIRWYINGKMTHKEEIAEVNGNEISHSTGGLMIGSDGEEFFNGAVDELKLYNYALTPEEVKSNCRHIDSLSISEDNQNKLSGLNGKDTVALKVTRSYIDSGKSTELNSGVTYKTSNKKVFTVSNTGKITAVNKGTANLKISHGGIFRIYKVVVN